MIKNEKKEKNSFYLTTKSDIIFISLVVFLSIFIFLSQGRLINRTAGGHRYPNGHKQASVYINGVLSDVVLLKPDRVIETAQGKWQLETRGGRIMVLRSDCPRKICAHTGWVSEPGETLLCVPNKILLEIDKESAASVDAVAY